MAQDTCSPWPLSYASRGSRRRLLLRGALLAAVVAVAAAGALFGPDTYRRWQRSRDRSALLDAQRQCCDAALPTDRPVLAGTDPDARDGIRGARSGEYAESRGWLLRDDPRRLALARLLAIRGPGDPVATVFLHARTTPSGKPRLVVLQADGCTIELGKFLVTVIAPGDSDSDPKVVQSGYAEGGGSALRAIGVYSSMSAADPAGFCTLSAARPDPADATRFTATAHAFGLTAHFSFRLEDDDSVSVEVRDERGFLDAFRAAAEAKSRTGQYLRARADDLRDRTRPLTRGEERSRAIAMLDDPDPQVRSRGAREVARLDGTHSSLVRALIEVTDRGDFAAREGLRLALTRAEVMKRSAESVLDYADAEPDPLVKAYLRSARRAVRNIDQKSMHWQDAEDP